MNIKQTALYFLFLGLVSGGAFGFLMDGGQLIYQYKESFTSRFECERQAYFEAEKKGSGDNKSSNYYCGTSEQFVRKYL